MARFVHLCLAAVFVLLMSGCKEDLFTQVPEHDANEMVDALYAVGIESSKVSVGDRMFNVQVAQGQMGEALRIARERGLPRQRYTDLGALFKKEGLVSTASEERVRFIYGVAQQIAGTLARIDGVVYANVLPVIPANDPLATKIKPSSASVFIKHDPSVNVEVLRFAIKDLVVRSIEGLSHDNVTVTFIAADAPGRVTRAQPVVPSWLVVSLSALGGIAALFGIGAVLWLWKRHRAEVVGGDGGDSRDGSHSDAAPLVWLGSLLGRGRRSARATNEARFESAEGSPTSTAPT